MTDPVISPDGKWMWTGSEWIPNPPTSAQAADSTINLEDSMMSGYVNLEQSSSDASSVINLKDSAMSGDINITQNNAEDITAALIKALEKTAALGQPSSQELTQSNESEYARLLTRSRQPEDNESDVDPEKERRLGSLARSEGRYISAEQHYLLALKLFKENGDAVKVCDVLFSLGLLVAYQLDDLERGRLYVEELLAISREDSDIYGHEVLSLGILGDISSYQGDLDVAEKYYREGLAIVKELDNPTNLLSFLNSLGKISERKGDLLEAEGWYRVGLTLMEKLGDRGEEADSLTKLASVLGKKGQKVEQRRMISKAVRIWREIGDSVPQYYLDEGY
jgi:tetratricopeptide (TPR) repeat protein